MKIKEAVFSKMGIDLFWNFITFLILGVSGIVLNVLIGRFYGPEALGIFNQAFSIYIIISQFSVFGIYMSTLKYTAQYSDRQTQLNQLMSAALVSTGTIALIISILFMISSGVLGSFFKSANVGQAIFYIAPGILFFSLNKVLLSYLNGLRKMRAYANFQSFRYLSIVGVLILVIYLKLESSQLTLAISTSEALLFIFLIFYSLQYFKFDLSEVKLWVKKHLNFGYRGFLSGALYEMNTRVDVIMIGLFSTDYLVGLYSLPAMLVEGIMQLTVVVRDNINPLITKYYLDKNFKELLKLSKKTKLLFYGFMIAVTGFGILIFPYFLKFFFPSQSFEQSNHVFIILMLGLFVASGYMPFALIFNQIGKPGIQTLFILSSLLTNIIFNLILIPIYGIIGAALGTGLSWVVTVVILVLLARKWHLKL